MSLVLILVKLVMVTLNIVKVVKLQKIDYQKLFVVVKMGIMKQGLNVLVNNYIFI